MTLTAERITAYISISSRTVMGIIGWLGTFAEFVTLPLAAVTEILERCQSLTGLCKLILMEARASEHGLAQGRQ